MSPFEEAESVAWNAERAPWDEMERAPWEAEPAPWDVDRAAPQSAVVDGVEIGKGSRVRLHPHPGGDIMDLALTGKVAVVEAIEQDFEDKVHVAVTVEDDPGRNLGDARQPGHRFFFALDEVAPFDGEHGEDL